jgi:hypothetical protein
MVTQHRPCVLGPKQAAPLQNGHDFAGEHVEIAPAVPAASRCTHRRTKSSTKSAIGSGVPAARKSPRAPARSCAVDFAICAVKTASACHAAKRRPVPGDPAYTSTGLR